MPQTYAKRLRSTIPRWMRYANWFGAIKTLSNLICEKSIWLWVLCVFIAISETAGNTPHTCAHWHAHSSHQSAHRNPSSISSPTQITITSIPLKHTAVYLNDYRIISVVPLCAVLSLSVHNTNIFIPKNSIHYAWRKRQRWWWLWRRSLLFFNRFVFQN